LSVRAHVIVNRRARRLVQRSALADQWRARATVLRVHETTSLEELDRVARLIAASPRVPVVLAGGDGSYMAGVTALAAAFGDRALPPVALAPGGTVGTIAKNWGQHGDPVRYTRDLLDAIGSGAAVRTRRPTLRIADAEGRRHVGFIVGTGLVARFFESYETAGAAGRIAAAKIVARVFAGSFVGGKLAREVLAPSPCRIEVDGKEAPFDHVSLLCASVVRDLGLGMRLLYRAGEETERFHVVATPLGARQLGPQMPLVLAGRPLIGPRIDALVRKLVVGFPLGSGAYVLDGDLFRAATFAVEAGPTLDVLTAPE
jgi:diacylglycerol kinase (ATP)